MEPLKGLSPLNQVVRPAAGEREGRRLDAGTTFAAAPSQETAGADRRVPDVDRPQAADDRRREEAETARQARQDAEAQARAVAEGKVTVSFNADAGRFVYQERDPRTDDVVWEYPADYILERMAERKEARQNSLDETT